MTYERDILFGDPSDEDTSRIEHFTFDTKAELDAFLIGLESAEGWHGVQVFKGLHGGKDDPIECPQCGARTDVIEYRDDLQAHHCLNSKCAYHFLIEFD